jgi:phosphocarrier protein
MTSESSERSVTISNRNGLHARPAAEIVKCASRYSSDITMVRDELEVNGKSIMGVMMLAAEYGSTLVVRASGPDATEAVHAIATLIEQKFGES